MKTIHYFLAFLLFLSTSVFGQLDKANKKYKAYEYQMAIPLYQKHLKNNTNDEIARYRLAESYRLTNQIGLAIEEFNVLIKNENPKEKYFLKLIEQLRIDNQINQAKNIAKQAQSNFGSDNYTLLINSLNRYEEFSKPKEDYNVNPVFEMLNESVFAPTSYKNNRWIVTKESSKANQNTWTGRYSTNLFDGEPGNVKFDNFATNIMSKQNDGVATFTSNFTEMYFNSVYDKGVKEEEFQTKKLKIVHAKLIEDKWVKSEEFKWNDPNYNTAHPNLTSDGKVLFFSSDRMGGKGGMDIYYCKWENNNWSQPINLENVNTKGNDIFPVFNENELYFSSNGIEGLGGLDLFKSEYKNGNYGKPINLHAPFNSTYDDFHILKSSSKIFYVSTNRLENHALDNIIAITQKEKAPETIEQKPVLAKQTTIQIKIEDKYTKTPLPYVKVQFKNSKNETVYKGITDPNGLISVDHLPAENYQIMGELNDVSTTIAKINKDEFSAELISKTITHNDPRFTLAGSVINAENHDPIQGVSVFRDNISLNLKSDNETLKDGSFFFQLEQNSDYKISAEKEGWISSKVAYETTKGLDRTKQLYVKLELDLQKPKANAIITLENIFYDLNKCDIKPKSAEELNRLIKLMNDYPKMTVQLSSHTDSRGSDPYNLKLSQCRADAAVEYLVSKGINKSRLVAKGFGETQLTNACSNGVKCSDADHQANRRTEFKILNM